MKIKINPEISTNNPTEIHPILSNLLDNKFLSGFLDDSISPNIPYLNELITTGLVPKELFSSFDDRHFNSNFIFFSLREQHIGKYGFLLLSEPLLNTLANQFKNKRVLEIGAGTGFLAKHLKDRNVELTAIDYQDNQQSQYGFQHKHTYIQSLDGIKFIKENKEYFDTVILSWPDYDTDFATQVLEQLNPGQTLYYVGENNGGCTANDRFFYLLDRKTTLNENLTDELSQYNLSWPGIHDRWQVYDIK